MKPWTLAIALLAWTLGPAEAADFSLRYIGQQSVPTGTLFEGVEFGGISALDRAADGGYTPIQRELLLDFDALKASHGLVLDNSEALSWGQTLANGHRTLLVVSDNNFAGSQTTQFLAFEVVPVPEPQTSALMLAGLAAVWSVSARRKGGRK